MSWVVNVVDTVDYRVAGEVLSMIRHHEPDSTVIKIPPLAHGVERMVAAVLKQTKAGGVNVLRIWGHGFDGTQEVGGGCSQDSWKYNGAISLEHLDKIAGVLASLGSRFHSQSSRLELKGCRVAKDDDGKELLVKLARLIGVRVLAACEAQWSFDWDGPVYQATPGGGVRQVAYTA